MGNIKRADDPTTQGALALTAMVKRYTSDYVSVIILEHWNELIMVTKNDTEQCNGYEVEKRRNILTVYGKTDKDITNWIILTVIMQIMIKSNDISTTHI